MKRVLRFTCHVVVAAWLFVALAVVWLSAPAADETPEPRLARVQPLAPEPEPAPDAAPPESEPESAPEPEPEVKPEPEAEPPEVAENDPAPVLRQVSVSDMAQGASLLDGNGQFPSLSIDYATFPSFAAYARAMHALGARFVVVRQRRIVAAIDFESHALASFDPAPGYSPRARDYTGERGLRPLAEAAKERFGERASVMMLVPRRIDAGLFGGLARALDEQSEPRDGLREIRGRYERAPGGGVHLRVETAVRRDGHEVPLDARFDLGQIARGAAA